MDLENGATKNPYSEFFKDNHPHQEEAQPSHYGSQSLLWSGPSLPGGLFLVLLRFQLLAIMNAFQFKEYAMFSLIPRTLQMMLLCLQCISCTLSCLSLSSILTYFGGLS